MNCTHQEFKLITSAALREGCDIKKVSDGWSEYDLVCESLAFTCTCLILARE